jgi:hypothetical protein
MMIQRSRGSSFFPGAYAFPGKLFVVGRYFNLICVSIGGVAEEADFSDKWKGLLGRTMHSLPNQDIKIKHEEKGI